MDDFYEAMHMFDFMYAHGKHHVLRKLYSAMNMRMAFDRELMAFYLKCKVMSHLQARVDKAMQERNAERCFLLLKKVGLHQKDFIEAWHLCNFAVTCSLGRQCKMYRLSRLRQRQKRVTFAGVTDSSSSSPCVCSC